VLTGSPAGVLADPCPESNTRECAHRIARVLAGTGDSRRASLMSLLRTGPNWHATTADVLSIVPIIHGNHPGRMVRNRLSFAVAGIPIRISEKVARHYGRQVVQFSLSLPHP